MAAHQAPPSLGFSRQEHWSGLPFPSPMHESEKWKWSRSVVSDTSRPHGLQPARLRRPWDFPGKNTGVGCHKGLLRGFKEIKYMKRIKVSVCVRAYVCECVCRAWLPRVGWRSTCHWEAERSKMRSLSLCLCVVVQSLNCVQLCNPTDCNASGSSILHSLLEFAQSRPLSRWCHPTISSSVVPFSSCPQSPSIGSFSMSQLFTLGGQSTGTSVLASVLPINIQGWFPLGFTGLI